MMENITGSRLDESLATWSVRLNQPTRIFRVATVLFAVAAISCSFIEISEGDEVTREPGDYATEKDILYRDGTELSAYHKERCRLDIYYPRHLKDFPTVVWFHGGGLRGGNREVPSALKQQGIAIVAANYRLHPKVKAPAYLEDAAAAVAWTIKNIERFGGSPKHIYASGHSAGGYLTSMIGLDRRWLAAHDLDANQLAGLIPYSGHTITHFTVRAERGIDGKQPIVDNLAPLFHVRNDAPPLLLISGDRDMELMGRYEETAYLWRMMQVVGHKDTEIYELDGFDHGGMVEPAHRLLLRFVREHSSQRPGKQSQP